MIDVVQELMRIYYEEEKDFKRHLVPKEAERYFKSLLKKERILTIADSWSSDKRMLEAYCKFWTITPEQVAKAVDENKDFFPMEEDINTGEVAHIFSLWVRSDLRKSDYVRRIRKMIIDKCPHIKWFTGQELKNNRRFRFHRIRR